MNLEVLQAWHIVSDDGAQVTSISVADARYFPTDDGKGDETYEVVLRNFGVAPVELPAKQSAARRSRCP